MEKQFNIPAWNANIIMGNAVVFFFLSFFFNGVDWTKFYLFIRSLKC